MTHASIGVLRTSAINRLRRSKLAYLGLPTYDNLLSIQRVDEGYVSQFGQDLLVDIVFGPHSNGRMFVDVGAHDGITFSNTYFLEKYRGWQGLCVEANPTTFSQLRSNRTCLLENCAVSTRASELNFASISGAPEMLSGIESQFPRRHLRRIKEEIETTGGSYETIRVQSMPLQDLLDKHSISKIDFLSVDVEGGELGVINSIDFSRTAVKLLAVENNYRTSRVAHRLVSEGFTRILRVGVDEFFASTDLIDEQPFG